MVVGGGAATLIVVPLGSGVGKAFAPVPSPLDPPVHTAHSIERPSILLSSVITGDIGDRNSVVTALLKSANRRRCC